jgi:hypothetical protein
MLDRSLSPNDGSALGVMPEKLTFDVAQHKRRLEDGGNARPDSSRRPLARRPRAQSPTPCRQHPSTRRRVSHRLPGNEPPPRVSCAHPASVKAPQTPPVLGRIYWAQSVAAPMFSKSVRAALPQQTYSALALTVVISKPVVWSGASKAYSTPVRTVFRLRP